MPGSARIALLAACFFWAISFIATKVALDSAPPLTVVALRLAISALCFGGWLALARVPRGGTGVAALLRQPRVLGSAFVLSLLGTGLHYGTQTLGLARTSAANASLYAVTAPITIAILGAILLRERLSTGKVLGIGMALLGVLLVMGPEDVLAFRLADHMIGDLLVLSSIAMWGLFTVFGKKMTDELGALRLTALVTIIGALWMAPIGLIECAVQGFDPRAITLIGWGAIAFLGVLCSFLATLLYFFALERSESQKVGVYLYTLPPQTALFSALFLGERLAWHFFAGSVLILAGVAITDRGLALFRRRQSPGSGRSG